jgi:hypothetical protein
MRERQPGPEPRRRVWLPLLIVGGVVSCLGILVLIGGAGFLFYRSLNDTQGFDAALWRQSTAGCVPDNPRLSMYTELEALLLRERPTKAEILTLLGPADGEQEAATLSYTLGYNIIDCDFVSITFDGDDRVREVRYVQG